MNTLTCLTLIVYMEARSESILTQSLVAQVALNRAEVEQLPLCKSMKKYRSYSWMWDGKPNKMQNGKAKAVAVKVAKEALIRFRLKDARFFNSLPLGKRYKTKVKATRSGKLLFY